MDQKSEADENRKVKLSLEDDYENAIARNIALEIWKNKQKKANTNGKVAAATSKKRNEAVSRTSTTAMTTISSKNAILRTNKVAPATTSNDLRDTAFSQLPANMICLVETFLKVSYFLE